MRIIAQKFSALVSQEITGCSRAGCRATKMCNRAAYNLRLSEMPKGISWLSAFRTMSDQYSCWGKGASHVLDLLVRVFRYLFVWPAVAPICCQAQRAPWSLACGKIPSMTQLNGSRMISVRLDVFRIEEPLHLCKLSYFLLLPHVAFSGEAATSLNLSRTNKKLLYERQCRSSCR